MKNTIFLLLFLVFLISSPKTYSQDSENQQIHQLAKFDSLSGIYSQISLDTAIMYHQLGLKIAGKTLLDAAVVYKMHLRLGILYRQKGDFKQALACDIRALEIAESLNDDGARGTANNSIGIDYYRMNELKKAELYFKTGLKYRIQDTDSAGIADSYYNLGMIYDDLEKNHFRSLFIIWRFRFLCSRE